MLGTAKKSDFGERLTDNNNYLCRWWPEVLLFPRLFVWLCVCYRGDSRSCGWIFV